MAFKFSNLLLQTFGDWMEHLTLCFDTELKIFLFHVKKPRLMFSIKDQLKYFFLGISYRYRWHITRLKIGIHSKI